MEITKDKVTELFCIIDLSSLSRTEVFMNLI